MFKTILKKRFLPKYRYLKKFDIKADDIVIDLGANIGDVSEYFASKKAQVFAYEPNLYAYQSMEKRFKDSRFVTLHQAAVSNYTGTAKLWLHESHSQSEVGFSQGSSLMQEKNNLSKDYAEVPVVHIDDVLSPHEKIKLLKVDIEGGEYDIIDSILKHADKIDHILLETHGEKYACFQEQEKELQEKIKNSPYKDKILTDWF